MSQTQGQSGKFYWRKPASSSDQVAVQEAPKPQEVEQPKQLLKSKLVIGIPCHDGESLIGKAVVKFSNLGAEVVVCDDGSTDMTEDIARKLGCKIVKHPRQLGVSDSITSLFSAARRLQAESLLTVSADSDAKMEEVTRLIEAVQNDECDIAIGSNVPVLVNSLEIHADTFTGEVKDKGSTLRAYGKKALSMIAPTNSQTVVVENEVLQFAEQQGLRVREFPVSEKAATRVEQKKKASALTRLMHFATVKHPLAFFGMPSVIFFALATFQAVYTGLVFMATKSVPEFGVSVTAYEALMAVVLGAEASVLFSHKMNGSKNKGD